MRLHGIQHFVPAEYGKVQIHEHHVRRPEVVILPALEEHVESLRTIVGDCQIAPRGALGECFEQEPYIRGIILNEEHVKQLLAIVLRAHSKTKVASTTPGTYLLGKLLVGSP